MSGLPIQGYPGLLVEHLPRCAALSPEFSAIVADARKAARQIRKVVARHG